MNRQRIRKHLVTCRRADTKQGAQSKRGIQPSAGRNVRSITCPANLRSARFIWKCKEYSLQRALPPSPVRGGAMGVSIPNARDARDIAILCCNTCSESVPVPLSLVSRLLDSIAGPSSDTLCNFANYYPLAWAADLTEERRAHGGIQAVCLGTWKRGRVNTWIAVCLHFVNFPL